MVTWKDETSYSRDDKKRVPRCWTLQLPWIILTVHRHIHYEPDQWLLSCVQLGIEHHELTANEIGEAKAEAIAFALERCRDYLKSLEDASK